MADFASATTVYEDFSANSSRLLLLQFWALCCTVRPTIDGGYRLIFSVPQSFKVRIMSVRQYSQNNNAYTTRQPAKEKTLHWLSLLTSAPHFPQGLICSLSSRLAISSTSDSHGLNPRSRRRSAKRLFAITIRVSRTIGCRRVRLQKWFGQLCTLYHSATNGVQQYVPSTMKPSPIVWKPSIRGGRSPKHSSVISCRANCSPNEFFLALIFRVLAGSLSKPRVTKLCVELVLFSYKLGTDSVLQTIQSVYSQ